jgi:hypothetical protein
MVKEQHNKEICYCIYVGTIVVGCKSQINQMSMFSMSSLINSLASMKAVVFHWPL